MTLTPSRILHLTLTRRWFDLIASGEKTEEYREIKPHWIARLDAREYDEIHFRNGYGPDAPFMRVACRGIRRARFTFQKKRVFVISLGEVLEVRGVVPGNTC
ncbi:MAG: hypothetical protein AB7E32_16880 [Desulfovibrio sp.]